MHHALELSDFRIALVQALENNEQVKLHRFVGDHELKSHLKKAKGNNRFRLYQKLAHPVTGQHYHFHPDGLFILKGQGKHEKHQRLFFIEIDRGTENLSRIRKKVIAYQLYSKSDQFKKFGNFESFTVLFQTNSDKRASNIQNHLVGLEGANLVLVTNRQKINASTLLSKRVWINYTLSTVSILKGAK